MTDELIERVLGLAQDTNGDFQFRRLVEPHLKAWPEGLEQGKIYRVHCDDSHRRSNNWLQVFVANDGDVHVSMQKYEDGKLHPLPSIRVCTRSGGGRNSRTRQALLHLADAIRQDNHENGVPNE